VYPDFTIINDWKPPKRLDVSISQKLEYLEHGMGIDQARKALRLELDQCFLNDFPGLMVVQVTPGSGKTTCAIRAAEEACKYLDIQYPGKPHKIILFSERHDQYGSVARGGGWMHVYGRNQDNCKNFQYAKQIGEQGVPFSVCDLCDVEKAKCEYWRQHFRRLHRFMPVQQLGLLSVISQKVNPILILDDLNIQSLLPDPVHQSLTDLSWLRDYYPDMAELLDPLGETIFQQCGNEFLADRSLYQLLDEVLPENLPFLEDQPFIDMPDNFSQLQDSLKRLPHVSTDALLKELSTELTRYRSGDRLISRIAFYNKTIIHYPRLILPDIFKKLSLVLLNATPFVQGIRHLFRSNDILVRQHEMQLPLHPETEVVYDINNSNSKSSIGSSEQVIERWIDQVKRYCSCNEQTLIIATKTGEDILRTELQDDVEKCKIEFGHYGALSGLNKYQNFDTIILAQPFNPSPVVTAELYRQIYGGTEGEFLSLETVYRTAILSVDDNTAYEVSIPTMADQRLVPLYEHLRHSEMIQAAHRLRPLLNPKKIVVLTPIPLEGFSLVDIQYSTRADDTIEQLCKAIKGILDEKGYASRKDIAVAAKVSNSTARNYFKRIALKLGASIKQLRIPTRRYPQGRMTEVIVIASQRKFL